MDPVQASQQPECAEISSPRATAIPLSPTSAIFQIASGNSNVQGRRPTMEDAHTDITELDKAVAETPGAVLGVPADEIDALPHPLSFFAVYDGHAGPIAANDAAAQIWQLIAADEKALTSKDPDVVSQCLVDAFESWDKKFLQTAREENIMDGCAAVACYIRGHDVFCANAGDSRAVLCRGGRAEPLSIDHKPSRQSEHDRIIAAGGRVHSTKMRISELAELDLGPERVWPGGLALSRGLGDWNFKNVEELSSKFGVLKELVTATPEVRHTVLQSGLDEFIIIACDGLWDVMTSQAACDFVRTRRALVASSLSPSLTPEKADIEVAGRLAQMLVQEAFFRDSQDNISVVIILIRDDSTPTSPDEWKLILDTMNDVAHIPEDEGEDKEDRTDFQMHVQAAVAAPHKGTNYAQLVEVVSQNLSSRCQQLHQVVSGEYPPEETPVETHDNPLDPSKECNFPAEKPNPPPMEGDLESWGIIRLPFGGQMF